MGSGAQAVWLMGSAASPPAVLRVPPCQCPGVQASRCPRIHCLPNGKEKGVPEKGERKGMPSAVKLGAEGSPQRQVPNGASVPADRGEREKEEEEVSLMLGGDRGGLTCHQPLIISSKVLNCSGTQHRETIQPPIPRAPQGKIKGNSYSPLSAP